MQQQQKKYCYKLHTSGQNQTGPRMSIHGKCKVKMKAVVLNAEHQIEENTVSQELWDKGLKLEVKKETVFI